MDNSTKKIRKWLKLDNAALIFPGQNRVWSNVYRITAVLDTTIDPALLKQALDNVLPRFPCYKVKLKNGFFWHYFVENEVSSPPVMEDINNPCHKVDFKENDRYLFKVYYFHNRVSIDMFHSLCDGHGSAVLLFSILGEYYRLCGEKISYNSFVLNPSEMATEQELEDSFKVNANSKAKYKRTDNYVYHAKGTKLPKHMLSIVTGTVSFNELHNITKENGVTITEYLAAVLMKVHIDRQLSECRRQKEVSVQVPIDLRKMFNSKTLRNFTVCMRTKLDPNKGEYSFEEILKLVSLQLRLSNNKQDLNSLITANMKIQRNKALRLIPLIIKDISVGISYIITGEQTTSVLLSNLGKVNLPIELEPHVKRCILMPGPGKRNPARVGVSTFGDNLEISFASFIKERDIEKEFFTFLVKRGIHVKIESNM